MEPTEYDWMNFILPFLFGALAFMLMELGKRLVRGAVVKEQHRQANDKLLALIHDLVRTKNEVVIIEVAIQEVLETMPVDRARWFLEMRQLAHSVPPLVLAQVKRFGLYEPPPEIAPPPPQPHHAVNDSGTHLVVAAGEESFAQVTDINRPVAQSAWGGRSASG